MKLSRKTVIGLVVVAAVGYYIYDRQKKGKSLNPFKSFAADEETFSSALNAGGFEEGGGRTMYESTKGATYLSRNCKTVSGNVKRSMIGQAVDGGIITATGNGTTTICRQKTRLSNL